MNKTYHSVVPMDSFRARDIVRESLGTVESVGGTLESPEANIEDAVLVLTLPEGAAPFDVVPSVEWVEVGA